MLRPLPWASFSSPPSAGHLGFVSWPGEKQPWTTASPSFPSLRQPKYHPARAIMSKAKATPGLREKTRVMSASEIERTLIRLAHQIVEKNNGGKNLGLVGIKPRGVPLAQRLGSLIATIEKAPVDIGTLDISFYRDD